MLKNLKENHKINQKCIELPTNYTQLDNLIGGFNAGRFIVLASRSGCGKTTFALNLLLNQFKNMREQNFFCVFFSLEMSSYDLGARLTAAYNKVPLKNCIEYKKWGIKSFEGEDRFKILKFFREGALSEVFVNEEPDITIKEISKILKKQVNLKKIKIVFIDCIQLVGYGEASNNNLNSFQRVDVDRIIRTLKTLALELNICIVATYTLERDFWGGNNSTSFPKLEDWRDFKTIEKNADSVLLMSPLEFRNNDMLIEVVKNKNGPLGNFVLSFNKEFSRLYEFIY